MIFLVHHGITGQKWGVRNGPPYPLSAGAKSAKEKRAETKSKKPASGAQLGERLANHVLANSGNKKTGLVAEIAAYTAVTIIPYLVFYGLAVYSIHKDKQKEEKEAQERFEKRNPKQVSELPKLKEPMDPVESMKLTNPGFPEEGHVMNCTFCTTAMALREKGYDVQAQTTEHPWFSDRFWERTFGIEKETPMKARTPKEIVDTLNSNGPGAYGNLSVTWKMGGGHSIFWKNDENGVTHVYDGQSGEEYELKDNSKLMRALNPSMTSYNRLDNVDPTDYVLAFVTPREEK